ncbi:MAG: 4Fe-4S dicluster domain-containing protein [Pseudomonadota bacterium]
MAKPTNFVPMRRFVEAMPAESGNTVNGLGEKAVRRASPFFWHPPKRQTHGKLQQVVTDYLQSSPEVARHFSPTPPGGRGPAPVEQAATVTENTAEAWTQQLQQFALDNEADVVGIARMDPLFVYEGYEVDEPWIVVVGVAMDYDELAQAPASFDNPTAAAVVGKEYNRAARSCRKLANHILGQGYFAKAWQGPYASAVNMLPAAIAAGLGELGKHGSLINRELGSRFRLSAVTTDMPLISDTPDEFGIDDYCMRCQACTNACPPGAISNDKQLVRGTEKWYVDFDKCIPYFGETFGCAVCIVKCPWSRPGAGEKILNRLAKRRRNG